MNYINSLEKEIMQWMDKTGVEYDVTVNGDQLYVTTKDAINYELIKTGTRRSKKVDVPTEQWQKNVEREADTLKEKWDSTEGKINRLFCSSTLTTERLDRLEKLIEKLEKDMYNDLVDRAECSEFMKEHMKTMAEYGYKLDPEDLK